MPPPLPRDALSQFLQIFYCLLWVFHCLKFLFKLTSFFSRIALIRNNQFPGTFAFRVFISVVVMSYKSISKVVCLSDVVNVSGRRINYVNVIEIDSNPGLILILWEL